ILMANAAGVTFFVGVHVGCRDDQRHAVATHDAHALACVDRPISFGHRFPALAADAHGSGGVEAPKHDTFGTCGRIPNRVRILELVSAPYEGIEHDILDGPSADDDPHHLFRPRKDLG